MPNLVTVAKEIFTIPSLLTDQECDQWLALGESFGFESAPINTDVGPRHRPDIRNNDRVILDDGERAEILWRRISGDVPRVLPGWQAIGLNQRLRYYRYGVGQKFDWHADGCVRLAGGGQSLLTFLVYLNDDFLGGETLFGGGVRIEPRKGMALLFSHWKKHKGNDVREGRKYVLRSDVMHQKTN